MTVSFSDLAEGVWKTGLTFGQLVAGTPSGQLLNALFLMLGFFVLLILAATRSRKTNDKADRILAFAFFAATCTYSAVLGCRLSMDVMHMAGRGALNIYLSTFTLVGRAAYLLLLAVGTFLAIPTSTTSRQWRVLRAACAAVVVLLLADRLDLFAIGHGVVPLAGLTPSLAHLALHLAEVVLTAFVVWCVAFRFRPLPSALLVSWVLLLLVAVGLAALHLPNRSLARDASLFSQLSFLLHVPTLFIAMSLRDRRQLFDANRRLRQQFGGVVDALLSLEEVSDTSLRSHSQRHADLARSVATRLGMSSDLAEEVFWAALLHDIGKLSLDREIFSLPRPLTGEEWAVVQRHPVLGARVLEGIPGLERVMTFIRYHHERWDGTGYPEGLRGDAAPLGARIVALIDAFDAMVSSRTYRRSRSLLDAVKEVRDQAGKHFDPAVVAAFLDVLKQKGISLMEAA